MPRSAWFSLERFPLTLTPSPAEPESLSGISKVRNSLVPSGVRTSSSSSVFCEGGGGHRQRDSHSRLSPEEHHSEPKLYVYLIEPNTHSCGSEPRVRTSQRPPSRGPLGVHEKPLHMRCGPAGRAGESRGRAPSRHQTDEVLRRAARQALGTRPSSSNQHGPNVEHGVCVCVGVIWNSTLYMIRP